MRAAGGEHARVSRAAGRSHAPHPLPGARRGAARRARSGHARAGAGRADRAAADSVERRDVPGHATRRPTSSTSIAPALSRGLVTPFRGVGTLPRRGAVGVAGPGQRGAAARRRHDGVDHPARFRGVTRAHGRGAGPARGERRERVGSRHRAGLRHQHHRRVRPELEALGRTARKPAQPGRRRAAARRRSMSVSGAGTTRRSTISTTWCPGSWWRW